MSDPIEYKGDVKLVSSDMPEKVRPKVVLGAPRFGMSTMPSERLMSDIQTLRPSSLSSRI
jgi:hypothetical protein